MRPTADMYQVLSGVYDIDWAYFSLQYVDVIHSFLQGLQQERESRAQQDPRRPARGKRAPTRVLDLACGTGILAVELARKGHRVWGIDRSERMIEVARKKAGNLPNLTFEVGDMTRFSLDGPVDLVSCTFDSINYLLSPGQVSDMFSRVFTVLAGGGLFVFDSVTERFFRQYNHASYTRFLGGERVTQRLTYNRRKREAVTVFRFSGSAVERHLQRPWDFREMEPLLRRQGFRRIRAWSDLRGSTCGDRTERLYCVAEKGRCTGRPAGRPPVDGGENR